MYAHPRSEDGGVEKRRRPQNFNGFIESTQGLIEFIHTGEKSLSCGSKKNPEINNLKKKGQIFAKKANNLFVDIREFKYKYMAFFYTTLWLEGKKTQRRILNFSCSIETVGGLA